MTRQVGGAELQGSIVLILGGAGLVGEAVARAFLHHAPRRVVVAGLTSAYLAVFLARRRRVRGAEALLVLVLGMAWWSLGFTVELLAPELSTKVRVSQVNWVGIVTVPTAFYGLALQLTGQGRWLRATRFAPASIAVSMRRPTASTSSIVAPTLLCAV